MRSLFLDELSEGERSDLADFEDACRAFFGVLQTARILDADEIERRLSVLDPGFELLEFEDHGAGGLCIEAATSDPAARPRLQRLATLAPNTVRVRTSPRTLRIEELEALVARQTGQTLAGARVRAGFARGHLLDLVVHLARAAGSADEAALSAAEIAVYGLLGDQLADDWIGRIDVAPLPRSGPLKLVDRTANAEQMFRLELLAETVDNAIRGLYEGLPAAPASADLGEWTLLEAELETGGHTTPQGDLLYASTRLPEMLKCFLEGAPFSSCRFSRRGERFCYLKYVHQGDAQTRAVERQALEDRIEAALVEDGVGSVVGNGIGTRHSYVDLALTDVRRALGTMRRIGQKLNLPRQSWILFCDSEWRREWIGIWSDSEAPETC